MSSKGALLAVVLLVTSAAGVFALSSGFSPGDGATPTPGPTPAPTTTPVDAPAVDAGTSENESSGSQPARMRRFDSQESFTNYLRTAGLRTGDRVAFRERVEVAEAGGVVDTSIGLGGQAAAAGGDGGGDGGAPAPDRYAQTNVQEAGIDEPDLLKTDGTHFYYAGRQERYSEQYRSLFGETDVLAATPPGTVASVGSVNRTGQLLLSGDELVVVGRDRVAGFDVSSPADPELAWERQLPSHVRTARLKDGTVYLVLASGIDPGDPCPVEPMGGEEVACTDVYHPDRPVSVDATYTAMAVDPSSGDVADRVSWVGARNSVVYMSENGLYVTYTERTPTGVARLDYLLAEDGGRPLLDAWVVERLEQVESYDLSAEARAAEVRAVVRQWRTSLPEERREELQRELERGFEEYVKEKRRSLATTHVVRVDVGGSGDGTGGDATMEMGGTGTVPGRPLNQFSMDEHEGHLRIATTVGERLGTESANDVYVLDAESLDVTGRVTGMGEGQRVYAVRFVGDTGYVVTFRRVDPLHVLDLSDPEDPTEEGELKLPGFSSYLHPLPGDRVLGIGEEDDRVKAVVFDVSDPTDPTIADSRVLDARWSAVSQSHHAFLLDPKHEVFFLPTERGGHVFGYEDGLRKVYTVDAVRPQRARYVDDYLYVFAQNRVVVVDEIAWETAASMTLGDDDPGPRTEPAAEPDEEPLTRTATG